MYSFFLQEKSNKYFSIFHIVCPTELRKSYVYKGGGVVTGILAGTVDLISQMLRELNKFETKKQN